MSGNEAGRLKGKTAIITGGAGSIGFASVKRFIDEGAKVAIVDRNASALAAIAKEFSPSKTITIQADVADEQDVKSYVGAAVEFFGPIDIFFSNAGNDGPILNAPEYPIDMFDSIIRVHVKGTFLACKYATPQMRDGGSFIITSSVVGVMGVPGNVPYVAAKHALIGICKGVAKELAPRRIRVNTVNPGPVDNSFMHAAEEHMSKLIGHDAHEMFNGIIPLGRHANPAEIANAVTFLASDESSFTTGSCLMIDGGMSA